MEFFKKEYPDTGDVAVDVTYVSFGDRLRAIRKEKGMSQDEFAKLLGTSKQVLSRYEIGQRIPKITQVQEYAKRLNVSADYLMGDSAEEAAFNSLCPKDHPPFYKIFLDVTGYSGDGAGQRADRPAGADDYHPPDEGRAAPHRPAVVGCPGGSAGGVDRRPALPARGHHSRGPAGGASL